MYTINDIYQRLATNQTAVEADHIFAPSSDPASSFHTLKEIYDAIPTVAANKVKLGTNYLGIAGTLLPDGGTAVAGNVLSGSTFFGGSQTDWNIQTGTMPNVGQQIITPSTTGQTITAGYHDGTGLAAGDADLISGNIKGGITLFGIAGDSNVVNTSSGDAVVGNILTGKKSWVDGVELTGTAAIYAYGDNVASKVLTSATGAGTYAASNLSVGTVKSGTAFGVSLTGEYPSATYTLPSASATADLASTAGNFTSSNGAVEWWQSDGTHQTATLDFPTLSNVCSTDTSNNFAGTLAVTASAIAVGNTYCGTAGTLLANMFNGTSGAFTGGSQANGGADDYNNGGAPASGRYASGWTACNAGNTYCGTGLSSADALDNSTNLIWSMPCNSSGCASFADTTPLTYSWDASAANNNAQTASQLCSAGSHGQTGWSLPHQKQLMQAYIDGSYGNLEASGVNRNYWSATTVSSYTTYAWFTNLSTGYTTNNTKTTAYYVRCARSAN
jgi:hypothetical protein